LRQQQTIDRVKPTTTVTVVTFVSTMTSVQSGPETWTAMTARRKTTTVKKGKIGAEPESGGLSGYTATLVALRLEHRSAGASISTPVAGIVLVLPEWMSWSHPNR
jgi:hypothetical protein